MIDLPPQLILPDHYVAKRPAIIRAHEGDADGLRAMDRERGIRAILPGMVPVIAGGPPTTLIDVLTSLGLTSNLQLCLDAGDADSYSSGQSWLDRSGNGYDFFRGTTSESQSSDPTFTGSAGDRGAYFAFDGGDYFTYDSTNETWMNNLHKNNARFTALFWVQVGGNIASDNRLFGTANATAHVGVRLTIDEGPAEIAPQLSVHNGGSPLPLAETSSLTFSYGTWAMAGVSVNEGGGTASFSFVNDSTDTFTATYNSPSSSNASFTMNIGASGGGGSPMSANSRMACVAMWEGTNLTTAQIASIFDATRDWFGV